MTEVSRELGIKLSTSKFILKSFKKFGRIFKKKSDAGEVSSVRLSDSEEEPEEQQPVAEEQKVVIVYCPVYVYVPADPYHLSHLPPYDYVGPQLF